MMMAKTENKKKQTKRIEQMRRHGALVKRLLLLISFCVRRILYRQTDTQNTWQFRIKQNARERHAVEK